MTRLLTRIALGLGLAVLWVVGLVLEACRDDGHGE